MPGNVVDSVAGHILDEFEVDSAGDLARLLSMADIEGVAETLSLNLLAKAALRSAWAVARGELPPPPPPLLPPTSPTPLSPTSPSGGGSFVDLDLSPEVSEVVAWALSLVWCLAEARAFWQFSCCRVICLRPSLSFFLVPRRRGWWSSWRSTRCQLTWP